METPEFLNQIIQRIISISPFLVVKIFIIIALLLYVAFAFIVYRQIKMMNRLIEAESSSFLTFLSIIHFLASIGIVLFAIIFL